MYLQSWWAPCFPWEVHSIRWRQWQLSTLRMRSLSGEGRAGNPKSSLRPASHCLRCMPILRGKGFRCQGPIKPRLANQVEREKSGEKKKKESRTNLKSSVCHFICLSIGRISDKVLLFGYGISSNKKITTGTACTLGKWLFIADKRKEVHDSMKWNFKLLFWCLWYK